MINSFTVSFSHFLNPFNNYINFISWFAYQDLSIFFYSKINLWRRINLHNMYTSDKTMSISLVEIEQIRRGENFLSNFSYCRNRFFASSMHFDLALIIAFLFVFPFISIERNGGQRRKGLGNRGSKRTISINSTF